MDDKDKYIEKLEKQNRNLIRLCDKLLDVLLVVKEDLLADDDETTIDGDVMPQINGKGFRCECGCNIFRKLKRDNALYKCNACEVIYSSKD